MLGSPGCGVGVVSTVVGLGAGVQWQQRESRLGGQGQNVRDFIELVLRVLQGVPLSHRRRQGLLIQLADVIVLRGESLLALLQVGIRRPIRLSEQGIVIHAGYLHDAVQAGQRSLAGAVGGLFVGRTGRESVGGLTAHAALAHVEVKDWLTEDTAHVRPEQGGGGCDLGHGQLGGEDLMEAGQLIKLVSTVRKRIKIIKTSKIGKKVNGTSYKGVIS